MEYLKRHKALVMRCVGDATLCEYAQLHLEFLWAFCFCISFLCKWPGWKSALLLHLIRGRRRQANTERANSSYSLSPSPFSYLNTLIQNNLQLSGILPSKTDYCTQTCINILLHCCSRISFSSKRCWNGSCPNGKRAVCDKTFDGWRAPMAWKSHRLFPGRRFSTSRAKAFKKSWQLLQVFSWHRIDDQFVTLAATSKLVTKTCTEVDHADRKLLPLFVRNPRL